MWRFSSFVRRNYRRTSVISRLLAMLACMKEHEGMFASGHSTLDVLDCASYPHCRRPQILDRQSCRCVSSSSSSIFLILLVVYSCDCFSFFLLSSFSFLLVLIVYFELPLLSFSTSPSSSLFSFFVFYVLFSRVLWQNLTPILY